MKILIAHNAYQIRGGEDSVVENEILLLKAHGHEIIEYRRSNDELKNWSDFKKLSLLKNTAWSRESYGEVEKLISNFNPDICHVHNFFPLITPSIYEACRLHQIPVVQTLHNYRLGCINGLFVRNNNVCEDCLTSSVWTGVKNKCYRDSFLQSFAVARFLSIHNKRNTWNKAVTKYICLSEFAENKFTEIGLEKAKLIIKPNFVEQPELEKKPPKKARMVFIGRLEESKGITMLLRLADALPQVDFHLVGSKPDHLPMSTSHNCKLHGQIEHQEALKILSNSTALIFPSRCYEGMPMTIIEAFAHKTPVIASNLGAMKSMIRNGENGLLFDLDNIHDLIQQTNRIIEEADLYARIQANAFQEYQLKYTPRRNAILLQEIYQNAIAEYEGS